MYGRFTSIQQAIPDQTVFGLKLGPAYPRKTWGEESAKLQASRRNRGIHEDRDYRKVIADARVKLEKDTALAVPCVVREDT